MKRASMTLVITLAIAALAMTQPLSTASAGAPGGPVQVAPAQDDKGDTPRPRRRMCDTAAERHAEILASSEARLKLAEAQKPAWSKFVEAANAAHQSMFEKMCGANKPAPARTLPQRLAREETMAQIKLDHLKAIGPSLLALYQTLSPEQQKIADHLPLAGHDHDRRSHNGPGPQNEQKNQ